MKAQAGKVWETILPASIFFALYELAAQTAFGLLELSLVALLASFLWEERERLRHPVHLLQQQLLLLRPMGAMWATLILYIGWDLVSVSYSPLLEGVWEKYKVVLLMLFLSVLLLNFLQKDTARQMRTIGRVFLACAVAAAALSIVNFAVPVLYPVLYGRRLSLRLDYNVFSSVVLMGLVAGTFLLERTRPLRPRFFFLYLLCAPVIVLSSSRRNALLLLCFVLWQLLSGLWTLWRDRSAGRAGRLRRFAGGWLAIFLSVVALCALLQVFLDWRYEQLLQQENPPQMASAGSALERYGALAEEEGGSKRMLIWSVALREQQQYSTVEKIVGRGFGSDVLLYRQSDDPQLVQSYAPQSRQNLSAHSFLLADLLNGGYIQFGLGVCLWFWIGAFLLRAVLLGYKGAMGFAISFGFVFLQNAISNRYGFLYDKYFWLLCCLLTAYAGLRRD